MAKILSKSGDSLADVYDVEGSIAGVEELLSKDVNLVHEMGATIFSERLISRIIVLPSAAILQNVDVDINFSFAQHTRVLGVQVIGLANGKITRAQISITTPPAGSNTDFPIFAWNSGDPEITVKMLVNGVTAVVGLLQSVTPALTPNLLMAQDDPASASTISMRARSSSFGAGTVVITALIYVAFAQLGGVNSRGLPLPGW